MLYRNHYPLGTPRTRKFVCYFWFVGWDCISLGLHFCWSKPNAELHLPFGFIRIGWSESLEPQATWSLGKDGRGYGLID